MRRAEQHLALFGEDQAARMTMEQRDIEFLLERADLPAHRRLRQPEFMSGMGEAAGIRHGVKYPELVPVHECTCYSAAWRRLWLAWSQRSASSAAMQPNPAAVTAWR